MVTFPLLGEWQALGPFGGGVDIVQVDPFHPDTVVAAASDGLLFRSADAGATWQPLHFPGALHGVLRAFVIDPRQPDTYLAGFYSELQQTSGLLRSTDAGRTWSTLPGLQGRDVWSIAIWRQDPRVLAAGTSSGVYLTRDDGETWRLIADPTNEGMAVVVSLAFDPLNSNVLFAGTPHLAWKTTDGGAVWRPVDTGMLDDSDVFSIAVDPAHPQRVFASACSGIYRSRNAGAMWSKLIGARGASYRTYFVALDPRQEDTIFAGTRRGLVKSVDGGATWRQLSTHATRYVAFDPHHPGRIYVATDDDGVERSDDAGESLRAINEGLCDRRLYPMRVEGDALYTHTVYDSGDGGIFRLRANQASWEKLGPEPRLNGDELQSLVPDGTASRWYGTAYNSLIVSMDSGAHWDALADFSKSRIADLYNAPGGAYLLAATDAGLYRSTDGGKVWLKIPLPAGIGRLRAFFALESDRVAALGSNGIFISNDGILWQAANPLPDHAEPYAIVESGALFVATSAGLMQSEDNGRSWRLVRGGLPASTVQAICRHPAHPGVLVVAQYDTLYESQDRGKSWTRISPDAPRLAIRQLAILPETEDRLFVLTERQGIFALPLEASAPDASN